MALPFADGVIVTLPVAPSHCPRSNPSDSPLALKSGVVLASCSMRAGRKPAMCWIFWGPVAPGDAGSCTKTCGSTGLGCSVSLEKKVAWIRDDANDLDDLLFRPVFAQFGKHRIGNCVGHRGGRDSKI